MAVGTLSGVTGLSIGGHTVATTVADAAAGDVDALARIVHAHHDDMARLAFIICGDQDLAQDAVQAAWPRSGIRTGCAHG